MKKFLLLMLFVLKALVCVSPLIGVVTLTYFLTLFVSTWFGFLFILVLPSIALCIILYAIIDPIDTLTDAL